MAGTRTRPVTHRIVWASLATIILLGSLGLGFTVFTLDLLSTARAYITGESLWSKGQQEAVYYLDRYAHTGEDRYLARARAGLAVPLGDRRARLALNEIPPDLETARDGMLQGGLHPADIPGMIRMYLYFGNAPYIRDAIEYWRQGDEYILAIDRVADALEREIGGSNPDPDKVAQLRDELEYLNEAVRPLEEAFSYTLGQGSRWLYSVLLTLSIIVLLTIVAIVATIFWWATHRITASEYKFRAIFEHVSVGMAQIAPDGTFIDVNNSLCKIIGWEREKLLGLALADLVYEEDRGDETLRLQSLWQGEVKSHALELRLVRQDSTVFWSKLILSNVEQTGHKPQQLILIVEDISEARKLTSKLDYQARHDPLTGMFNRREFESQLAAAIDNAEVEDVRHVICFLDLDQFKIINDTCGHMAGDELLRQVGKRLRRHVRRSDVLARLGGDEFGIIFFHCTVDVGQQLADKLCRALADTDFEWDGNQFSITASLGLVEFGQGDKDMSLLLQQADAACYMAKKLGRSRVYAHVEAYQ